MNAVLGTTSTLTVTIVNNTPPVASNLSISDNNGGVLIPGVSLIGNYTYTDAESDPQGATIVQWLRNGTTIAGATSSISLCGRKAIT